MFYFHAEIFIFDNLHNWLYERLSHMFSQSIIKLFMGENLQRNDMPLHRKFANCSPGIKIRDFWHTNTGQQRHKFGELLCKFDKWLFALASAHNFHPHTPSLNYPAEGERERKRDMYFLPDGKLTKAAYYTQIMVARTIWEMSYGAEPSLSLWLYFKQCSYLS